RRLPPAVTRGQPHLGGARGREWIERDEGHAYPKERALSWFRQTLDVARLHQLDRQAHPRLRDGGDPEDPDSPHIDSAGDGFRRRSIETPFAPKQIGAVVGDEARSLIDQAKRKIRLAGPRGTKEENSGARNLDARGMDLGRAAHGRRRVVFALRKSIAA